MHVSFLFNVSAVVMSGAAVYYMDIFSLTSVVLAFFAGLIMGLTEHTSARIERQEEEL
jgi:Kef-type K+ transport system membrane component KefB